MSLRATGDPSRHVVLVHGVWMTGLEMRLLGNRLRECGFSPHYFHYASLTLTPAESAARLAEFIVGLKSERLHIVAHSLGGIVTLYLFDLFSELPDGRVVLLGSPVQGSGVARILSHNRWTSLLLGVGAQAGLTYPAPPWRGSRELGVISGTRRLGVGRILGGLHGDNDGTVSVEETRIRNARDHCLIEVSHTGMLFSPVVAEQACAFLRSGCFRNGRGAVE